MLCSMTKSFFYCCYSGEHFSFLIAGKCCSEVIQILMASIKWTMQQVMEEISNDITVTNFFMHPVYCCCSETGIWEMFCFTALWVNCGRE